LDLLHCLVVCAGRSAGSRIGALVDRIEPVTLHGCYFP